MSELDVELALKEAIENGSMKVNGDGTLSLTEKGRIETEQMMWRAGVTKEQAKKMSASEFINKVAGS